MNQFWKVPLFDLYLHTHHGGKNEVCSVRCVSTATALNMFSVHGSRSQCILSLKSVKEIITNVFCLCFLVCTWVIKS